MVEVKFVKQEHKFGCAIACLAMVLGKTYEEIDRDFLNDFEVKGMKFNSALQYLGEHGFSVVYKTTQNYYEKDFARKEMFRPFAPIHLISVKSAFDAKNSHLVVMTEKGKLICPQEHTDNEIRNCYEVLEVAGLYK